MNDIGAFILGRSEEFLNSRFIVISVILRILYDLEIKKKKKLNHTKYIGWGDYHSVSTSYCSVAGILKKKNVSFQKNGKDIIYFSSLIKEKVCVCVWGGVLSCCKLITFFGKLTASFLKNLQVWYFWRDKDENEVVFISGKSQSPDARSQKNFKLATESRSGKIENIWSGNFNFKICWLYYVDKHFTQIWLFFLTVTKLMILCKHAVLWEQLAK